MGSIGKGGEVGAEQVVRYTTKYAPTLAEFHRSNAFVRGIMGPFGSGKSTACTMEILIRAMEQAPCPQNGRRYTRWAIVRNSYPELKTTTLKTWGDWCPPSFGKLTMSSPIRHYIETPELDIEILFLALDRAEDQKKLLSLELTGAWLNEAREIPKAIVDAMTGRVGRYPSVTMGGCSWSGIIMDTNPPDDQSWWYRMAEEELPSNWEFFKQPSGLSPFAENVPHLPPDYYKRIASGKDEDWVRVYVKGEYGYLIEGKPVFPTFRDRTHISREVLEPIPELPLLVGVDFGLTPAAIIAQKTTTGQWRILDEYVTEDMGVQRFAEHLSTYLSTQYPNLVVQGGWGDPAGRNREGREETCFDLMNEYCPLNSGERWREAPTNDPVLRFEAVNHALDRLIDGDPGFIISPKCRFIRKGFNGGYHYKFIRTGDGTQTQEKPNKNKFSHPMEALQYLLLGGGEHNVVLRKAQRVRAGIMSGRRSTVAKGLDYNIFG